ncbi:hypothetical protein [uncultured Anaerovibrio sp.]|uniref:hypothetical protein n=1 Tax=uncultured Anaerovibrio sp. TaxID=361586 RepID=UPI002627C12C|nr:hypothetical protein [uncultured Anaerovibrio sp.]
MEQSFNFMGEVLSVSKGRDQYTYVRKIYHNLAKNLQQEFIEKFESYDDMDELHEDGLSDGYNLIMKAVDRSLDLLVDNEIIDINRNLFLGIYEKYCNWESVFGKIDDQYMEIVLDEEQKAAYRQARKENRMRFSGGGFGISGALKGTAKAEALNLATGAIYGAVNLVGKGISMIGTSMKKSNLFNDPQTKMTLHLGIYWNIFRMHYALIDILRKKKGMDFDVPSDDDESSAKAIIDNLPKIQGDKTDYIIQALNLYPYNYELYKYVLENMDDNDAEIAPIADYFGVGIADFVQEKIEKIVSKFNLEDEDSLLECKNVVEHTMELYLLTSSPTIELLEHKLAEIDIVKRTFKGFLYETRELREKAVEQDAEIRALCDNVVDEYQALFELKTKIINTEYLGNVKDEYIASLTRRTFEHEKAELVNNYNMVDKNDLEAINSLRTKIGAMSRFKAN